MVPVKSVKTQFDSKAPTQNLISREAADTMNRGMHQKFTELQQVVEEEAWQVVSSTYALKHWGDPPHFRTTGLFEFTKRTNGQLVVCVSALLS